jgi:hypothetical protein
MSAPRRWLETEQTSSEALDLLRAGRPPRSMDDTVRRRSRQRVAGLATLPAVAGALAGWPQLALGALVGAASTVAVMSALSAASQPAPTSSSGGAVPNTSTIAGPPSTSAAGPAARAPLPAPASQQPDASGDATPTLAGSTRGPVVGTKPVASESPRPTPPVEGLQAEIALLEEARRKLAPDPAQAQRLLLEHEQRFAGGQLRIEREFLLIDALVRLGRRSEAEARARVLEGQAPRSLYGERLDQILGGSGSSNKTRD